MFFIYEIVGIIGIVDFVIIDIDYFLLEDFILGEKMFVLVEWLDFVMNVLDKEIFN